MKPFQYVGGYIPAGLMQIAVRFSLGRACLFFGVAGNDRQQSKIPRSNWQGCLMGIFYATSFRPFSISITPFFPVPVPPVSDGEDLKTDPLRVPPWLDNLLPSASCSHLLNGHWCCFPSVSSTRTAATVLPWYQHSCPQLQQKNV